MSLYDNVELLEESRRIIDDSNEDCNRSDEVLMMKEVAIIYLKVKHMVIKTDNRLDELKQDLPGVSSRIRNLENLTESERTVKEYKSSCKGVSNTFDKTESQI